MNSCDRFPGTRAPFSSGTGFDRRSRGRIRLILSFLTLGSLGAHGSGEISASSGPRGRILDRNGIVLAKNTETDVRHYPYRALACHVVGFVNEDDPERTVGKFGVEADFDDTLSRGIDVKLTLDARIQSAVEHILREGGVGRGCALVVDPSTGDILASASFPSFDPCRVQENFDTLLKDPFRPLWNRAITARPPGSTFHLAVALAAARKDALQNSYECKPLLFGERKANCWIYNATQGSHGNLAVPEAVTKSCGSCMKQLGVEIGIDDLADTAGLLGFGRKTGVSLPNEHPGTIGSPAELLSRGDNREWKAIETAFLSGGQGWCLATPLQTTGVTSAIANGGLIHTPRIQISEPVHVACDLREHGIDPDEIADCRKALADLVKGSSLLKGGNTPSAGITGTARSSYRGNPLQIGWFTGFSPAENPRFVVTVMTENALSGARVSGVLAKRIFAALSEDLPPAVAFEPVEGHNLPLDKIE